MYNLRNSFTWILWYLALIFIRRFFCRNADIQTKSLIFRYTSFVSVSRYIRYIRYHVHVHYMYIIACTSLHVHHYMYIRYPRKLLRNFFVYKPTD